MKKQIVQFLLENQGMVSVAAISVTLKQPLSAVQSAIEALSIRNIPNYSASAKSNGTTLT